MMPDFTIALAIGFVIGFVLGYGLRAIISYRRRRRARRRSYLSWDLSFSASPAAAPSRSPVMPPQRTRCATSLPIMRLSRNSRTSGRIRLTSIVAWDRVIRWTFSMAMAHSVYNDAPDALAVLTAKNRHVRPEAPSVSTQQPALREHWGGVLRPYRPPQASPPWRTSTAVLHNWEGAMGGTARRTRKGTRQELALLMHAKLDVSSVAAKWKPRVTEAFKEANEFGLGLDVA